MALCLTTKATDSWRPPPHQAQSTQHAHGHARGLRATRRPSFLRLVSDQPGKGLNNRGDRSSDEEGHSQGAGRPQQRRRLQQQRQQAEPAGVAAGHPGGRVRQVGQPTLSAGGGGWACMHAHPACAQQPRLGLVAGWQRAGGCCAGDLLQVPVARALPRAHSPASGQAARAKRARQRVDQRPSSRVWVQAAHIRVHASERRWRAEGPCPHRGNPPAPPPPPRAGWTARAWWPATPCAKPCTPGTTARTACGPQRRRRVRRCWR